MATLIEFMNGVNGNKPDSLQAFLATMSLEDAKPRPEAATPPTNIFPNPDETPCLGSIPKILEELTHAELREQLLEKIISTSVEAHMDTCIYTSDKVSDALESIEQRGGAPNMPDPSKMNPAMMWQKFMANFMPVMTRVTRFCKRLPGFQDLCAEDQIHLIKQGAFELMVCRYALLIDPETNEMYDPNLEVRIPRGVMSRLPVGEVFDEFFTFAAKIRPMNLSDEEIGLLTTVMVFCPDRMGLQDRAAIYKLQGLYLQALRVHIERNHPGNHKQFLEEALSVIPVLRKINFAHARLMTNMKQGNPQMKDALPDTHKKMFDGKI